MKYISILGSTGSIGTQTLEVIKNLGDEYKVVSLSTNTNIDLLEEQIREFRPKTVAVYDKNSAKVLKERMLGYPVNIEVGLDGLIAVATEESANIVVTSVVGMIGLLPTLEAIKCKKNVALANKETLVTAGELVMKLAKDNNVTILPVDSEHSAIYQCLQGNNKKEVHKLILTASGGPFRGKKTNQLRDVSLMDALNHPNWSMGKKITIDSATLMNKGLEVIEAKWLFDVDINNIDVVVHPQSIVHSMIEYIDGSVIAQLGVPNMKVPIQYALTYPIRNQNNFERLDLTKTSNLSFEKPDMETFKCLKLAIDSIAIGGTLPTVLNASNEAVVDLFLGQKISFLNIQEIIEEILSIHKVILKPSLNEIIDSDRWAREMVYSKFN